MKLSEEMKDDYRTGKVKCLLNYADKTEKLELENENLKCCGNCYYLLVSGNPSDIDFILNCSLDMKQKQQKVWECCDEWQWDQLNRKDRMR
jgi:hypothetical protein